jgi:hypothetical protein
VSGDALFRCAACGEPILDDQAVLRLSIGVGRPDGFSHALMRDDVFLHAGHPDAGPWGDEPNQERWCATPTGLEQAQRLLGAHVTTGGSTTYHGE